MRPDLERAAAPGLWRRLAAMFYDSWLIVGLWFFGATVDYAVRTAVGLDAMASRVPLQVYLVICPVLFFGWFWTHGGQSLGMRAWRLKLVAADGGPVDWRMALLRVAGACVSAAALGLGYLWILVDPANLAWHDRLSHTRLVVVKRV